MHRGQEGWRSASLFEVTVSGDLGHRRQALENLECLKMDLELVAVCSHLWRGQITKSQVASIGLKTEKFAGLKPNRD